MKLGIKRREAILLVVLLLVLVCVFYYLYVYEEKEKIIAFKTAELEELKPQVDTNNQNVAKEGILDNRIKELEDSIKSYSGRYYSDIKQENEILNIQSLYETSAIDISSMNFDKSVSKLSELANEALTKINSQEDPFKEKDSSDKEKLDKENSNNPNFKDAISKDSLQITASSEAQEMDQMVVSLKTTMNYKGTFEDLEKFMANIYANPKYIVLESINIQSDGEGILSGNMSIVMHGLPKISELFGADNHIYYKGKSRRASESEVFMPYETFIKPPEIAYEPSYQPETEPIYDDLNVSNEVEPEKELDPFDVKEGEIAKTLYGFEGVDYFFMASNETVNGSVSRVSNRKQGLHGALMNYEFMDKSDENVAYFVFDKNPIIVNDLPDRLEMFVYTGKAFKNKLKLVLVDQFSEEHVLDMTLDYVEAKEEDDKKSSWAIASATLPENIGIPFAIEQIYVCGAEDSQSLSGSIIFDNLRMIRMEQSDVVIPE